MDQIVSSVLEGAKRELESKIESKASIESIQEIKRDKVDNSEIELVMGKIKSLQNEVNLI